MYILIGFSRAARFFEVVQTINEIIQKALWIFHKVRAIFNVYALKTEHDIWEAKTDRRVKEIPCSTAMIGDVNMPGSEMDRFSRQKSVRLKLAPQHFQLIRYNCLFTMPSLKIFFCSFIPRFPFFFFFLSFFFFFFYAMNWN
jgi:hypothetical protein